MNKKIRVGSRDSMMAIKQAQIVMEEVKKTYPALEFELVLIKTIGDKILDKTLGEIGGKGLFIKELEQALQNGSIDIAVHSYKDMPYEETEGLPIVALSKRGSPFDALVLPQGATKMDSSKPAGSSSLRRTIQFSRLYDGFATKAIRGNITTRLAKLDSGEYSSLILAEAGLKRLSLQQRIFRVFSADEMIPSGGQGILAVQGRQGEDHSYLKSFHDLESATVSKAERQYLKTLGGDCTAPVAVYGQLHNSEILLTGMYVDACGNVATGKLSGEAQKAEWLGETLAKDLKARLNNK